MQSGQGRADQPEPIAAAFCQGCFCHVQYLVENLNPNLLQGCLTLVAAQMSRRAPPAALSAAHRALLSLRSGHVGNVGARGSGKEPNSRADSRVGVGAAGAATGCSPRCPCSHSRVTPCLSSCVALHPQTHLPLPRPCSLQGPLRSKTHLKMTWAGQTLERWRQVSVGRREQQGSLCLFSEIFHSRNQMLEVGETLTGTLLPSCTTPLQPWGVTGPSVACLGSRPAFL